MLLSSKYPRAIPYLEIDRNLPKAPGLTATSSASEVNQVSHTLLDDPVMADSDGWRSVHCGTVGVAFGEQRSDLTSGYAHKIQPPIAQSYPGRAQGLRRDSRSDCIWRKGKTSMTQLDRLTLTLVRAWVRCSPETCDPNDEHTRALVVAPTRDQESTDGLWRHLQMLPPQKQFALENNTETVAPELPSEFFQNPEETIRIGLYPYRNADQAGRFEKYSYPNQKVRQKLPFKDLPII
ncbi:uncharacterized protein FMAN_09930 [Fusarium mangiferae]|uniref:Uncharacterized protein n=1 Tax=Fusarium mangiferae TaxID=192010 RepID=A0A1L7TPE0_FUSMA|nr:uncharacterized protein FMAN_09930 [Fusarium mangiferae]CVL00510.1 uncharacterized protein FMAN_09930 [Fusarium mangiferae]